MKSCKFHHTSRVNSNSPPNYMPNGWQIYNEIAATLNSSYGTLYVTSEPGWEHLASQTEWEARLIIKFPRSLWTEGSPLLLTRPHKWIPSCASSVRFTPSNFILFICHPSRLYLSSFSAEPLHKLHSVLVPEGLIWSAYKYSVKSQIINFQLM
jgi:hypothetical protein